MKNKPNNGPVAEAARKVGSKNGPPPKRLWGDLGVEKCQTTQEGFGWFCNLRVLVDFFFNKKTHWEGEMCFFGSKRPVFRR